MSATHHASLGAQKKLARKLAKVQHTLQKETGICAVNYPTSKLAICNSGLVNGLTEVVLFVNFSKFGNILDVIMLPGKSCSFVRFSSVDSSIRAYEECNGRLEIAQSNKPVYLHYVKDLPMVEDRKSWDELPPGLELIENFVDEQLEEKLIELSVSHGGKIGNMKHRFVKHFGYEFKYDTNNVTIDEPLDEDLPKVTETLWEKLPEKFRTFKPDQLTINKYTPGQGIPSHVDTHNAFEDPIMCLSLGSDIVMEFKKASKHICVLLPKRSLMIMSGESRYDWTHGIVPRKFDIVFSNGFTSFERQTRISYTFRKVLKTKQCLCGCDQPNEEITENLAQELEDLHVHKVYDQIANHFSDTRHKPWQNVLEFVQSFELGDIFLDVGCGNGKCLGNNSKIYEIGCDRSSSLIDICNQRNFEAFRCDCLSIPIRDNLVDGAISIAVIHHLSTENRRFNAIAEMVRVLRVGGRGLIYVWAHNQMKDNEKTSYIMQDRKNRKETAEIVADFSESENVKLEAGSIDLPVHTNRKTFKSNDLLVPWKLNQGAKLLRYYHVFQENELENLCVTINIRIIKMYYDQGNWCAMFEKL